MRYFKPELLARCRSLDEDVAEAAADEWEQAIAKYNSELAATHPLLPAGVRSVLDRFSLHDGRILGLVLAKRWLSLIVRLEGTSVRPGQVLELKYNCAKGIHRRLFSMSVRTDETRKESQVSGRIQYDEFRKVADEPVPLFSHSLLMTGGVELRIRFTDLRVRRLKQMMLPSVAQAGLESA